MVQASPSGPLLRVAALGVVVLGTGVALLQTAAAQPLEGTAFEQSGSLVFKFQNLFGGFEPGGGISPPDTTRIKYGADATVVFGPAEGLAPDAFIMPIVFAEGVLILTGTWSANTKGKITLDVDASSLTEQLDGLVLGSVQNCRAKAKVKVRSKRGERSARARIKTRCRLRGVSPAQRLKVGYKGKGPELLP